MLKQVKKGGKEKGLILFQDVSLIIFNRKFFKFKHTALDKQ